MTDPNTTNARVPHTTLAQVRELKNLLGLKSLARTWQLLVAQAFESEAIAQVRETQRLAKEQLNKTLSI